MWGMMGREYSIIDNYNRKIGAICSSIPAILYLSMSLSGLYIEPYILLWSTIQFIPLILAGYFLDIIAKSRIFNVFREREWITIILTWIVLFPLARVSGIIASDVLILGYLTYTTNQLTIYMLLSIILGAIYGFFFISAYLYLLKVAMWRRRR